MCDKIRSENKMTRKIIIALIISLVLFVGIKYFAKENSTETIAYLALYFALAGLLISMEKN